MSKSGARIIKAAGEAVLHAQVERLQADVARLTAERDAALALVAAAYEAAASEVAPLLSSALVSKASAHTESFANAMGERADGLELSIRRIRALTPADALAVQAARDERMRAEGMATAYAKAQQAIADLPYPKDEAAVNEQENCYRAVEALATLEKHHE